MSAARDNWLKERQTGIGASESAAVIGVHPYMSALEVYGLKRGIVEPTDENEYMEWGRRLEPVIADAYADRTGHEVIDPGDYTIFRNPSDPYIIATPDRFVHEQHAPEGHSGRGVMQIKTAGAFSRDDWKDEPPVFPQVQVQHEMIATDCTWGVIVALLGGQKLVWFDVVYDRRFARTLMTKLKEFWQNTAMGQEPAPTHATDGKVLDAMWKSDEQEVAHLTNDYELLDADMVELKAQVKQLQARVKRHENKIKAAMGSAATGKLPNGITYTWRTQERDGYTVKPRTIRQLRRKAPKGTKHDDRD